jgi:hypothetical protein
MSANYRKKDGIYPLITIEIANTKERSPDLFKKRCKNIKSGFAFSAY